ncbi:hypothetical protein A7E78_05495 [Syntrophotalea acetylenivorans]|uniref:Flagellar protein FlgN n=1 Tax=Syntrophotalea acetylenivorans TaxID=1842532 RepID=A0A1L3GN39_9BACT|nr:hypothetical protein [Syntrophotalea acetylenivorans]APG27344.1 hypothetical protein A7E78_05495 [Syntrophotalea acetylenivorans]
MSEANLKQRLENLLQLILTEREQAKGLDMASLQESAEEKQRLLQSIGSGIDDQSDPEVQQLANQVREENRRNAYLFYLTLGWVREQMTFFGQRTAPTSYGSSAAQISEQRGGRLLSGRI